MNDRTSRIPRISPDRLDTSDTLLPAAITADDRRAKAFIKDREPLVVSAIRVKKSNWDRVKLLAHHTNKSINYHLQEAIELYLSQEVTKGKLTRALKRQLDSI